VAWALFEENAFNQHRPFVIHAAKRGSALEVARIVAPRTGRGSWSWYSPLPGPINGRAYDFFGNHIAKKNRLNQVTFLRRVK